MSIRYTELDDLQALSLDTKIERAVQAIGEGFAASRHNQAIAFSGGKDSTVLWWMIRRYFPERRPYVIFGNTGVEYPESLRFAREIGRAWGGERFKEARPARLERDGLKYEAQREVLAWLEREGRLGEVLQEDGKLKTTETLEGKATSEMRADFERRGLIWRKGTTMSYWWCADQYGFPILGKSKSKLDARRINIDCFLRWSKSASENEELLAYYNLLRRVKISQHCCKLLKKEPSERMQAELDVNGIPGVYGTLVDEDRVKEWIDEAPTIDAALINHSKWVYYRKQGIAVCKNCSFERGVDANFGHAVACPNCGARMDREVG